MCFFKPGIVFEDHPHESKDDLDFQFVDCCLVTTLQPRETGKPLNLK